ncbi:hypothetical protein D3C81_1652240 [compost metagenome]
MRITAMQANNDIGFKVIGDPINRLLEAFHPGGILGIRLKRDVQACSVALMLAPLLNGAGAGE